MAQICAAGIPNASEFARRRVHLPGSKAAKGAGGARYRQPCVQLRAQFSQQREGELRPGGPGCEGELSPSLKATAAAGILYPFRYPSCRTLR